MITTSYYINIFLSLSRRCFGT